MMLGENNGPLKQFGSGLFRANNWGSAPVELVAEPRFESRQGTKPRDGGTPIRAAGELSANEIANLLRISRATVFRQLRRAREIDSLARPPKPAARRRRSRYDSPHDHETVK
jgi:hypothetical protein